MELRKGQKLKNRYEIVELLGAGGFGATYKAVDHLLHRFVAIKTSERNLSQEVRILKALENVPHICHIYDSFTEQNTHFLVMRLIVGKSLSSYQKENGGTIPLEKLKKLLPSALITLDQIHDRGIIHRDISPGNFLMGEDDTLYLIDFGAATSLKESSLKNLLEFTHKGLDAPEHLESAAQGPWTDIFSLCATIIYLLTGQGIPAPEDRARYDAVPGMLLHCSLTPRMQNALIKGVSLVPEKRFPSVLAFAKEFLGKDLQDSSLEKTYSVHYHARTATGYRTVNQDNFMVDRLFAYAGEDCEIKGYIDCNQDEIHVVALADGVSISNHSELASKAAIQAVSHFLDYYQDSKDLPQNLLEEFLNQVNEKIIFLSTKLGKTATTISLFLWKNNQYIIANIGDSPIYGYQNKKFSCLTVAQTVANKKKQTGEPLEPKDFHALTCYLGKENIAGNEMAHIKTGTLEKGDIFLLCSDGIAGSISDWQKKHYIKKDGGKAIHSIFKHALKQPNAENCTAIILKF